METMPLEVLLVIGDFDGPLGQNVRKAATKAYVDAVRLPTDPAQEVAEKLWDIACGDREAVKRVVESCEVIQSEKTIQDPVPVFLNDCGRARSQEFPHVLFGLLRTLNVVAIVSFGTAENTVELLKALGPLDVPVLVTLASNTDLYQAAGATGDDSGPRPRNILRLVPTNESQAQALVSRIMLDLQEGKGANVKLFYYPRADRFTTDMRETLKKQLFLLRSSAFSYQEDAHADKLLPLDKDDILLLVCYKDGLEVFGGTCKNNGAPSRIYLTDACDYDALEDDIESKIPFEASTSCRISRRAYRLSTYVADAVRTVIEASKTLKKEVGRPQALTPFLALLRTTLTNDSIMAGRYLFQGRDNVAGGYIVETLDSASDKDTFGSQKGKQAPSNG